MPPHKPSTVAKNYPTPDEIAARAAAIRSTWTSRKHRIRAGLLPYNTVDIVMATPGALDGRRGSMNFD